MVAAPRVSAAQEGPADAVLQASRVSYVSIAAQLGGDGSKDRPWRSLQNAVSRLGPGDTLIIAPGVYREAVDLVTSGREDAPITLLALPGAVIEVRKDRPKDPAIDTNGQSYWRISGFTVKRSRAGVMIGPGSRHIRVERIKAYRCDFAVRVQNASDVTVSGSRGYLCRNAFRGDGRSRRILFEDSAGFYARDVYEGMDLSYLNGDAFIFEKHTEEITILRCRGVRCWDSGFDIKSRSAVLSGVVAYGNKNNLKLWGRDVRVNGALAYGAVSQSAHRAHPVDGMGVNVRSGRSVICNATFVDNEAEDVKVGEGAHLRLTESIVARRLARGELLGEHGRLEQSDVLWYRQDGFPLWLWRSKGQRWADPKFLDWSAADFRLAVDSPGIRAGRGQLGAYGSGGTGFDE